MIEKIGGLVLVLIGAVIWFAFPPCRPRAIVAGALFGIGLVAPWVVKVTVR